MMKIAELTELTNDMDNLLAATDVGTLFLDKQLRIRRFTAPIASEFDQTYFANDPPTGSSDLRQGPELFLGLEGNVSASHRHVGP